MLNIARTEAAQGMIEEGTKESAGRTSAAPASSVTDEIITRSGRVAGPYRSKPRDIFSIFGRMPCVMVTEINFAASAICSIQRNVFIVVTQ